MKRRGYPSTFGKTTMSLYDELKKHLTDMVAASPPGTDVSVTATHSDGLVSVVIHMVQSKGLGQFSEMFKSKGLGDVFGSWVSKGVNLPISVDQIRSVLGPEQLAALAKKAGIDVSQVTTILSHLMPSLVDKLTPHGLLDDSANPESATPAE